MTWQPNSWRSFPICQVPEYPDAQRLNAVEEMLALCLPRYRDEGKSYLTIAIGCTGGRHRSVSVAVDIAKRLEHRDWRVRLQHRDMHRDAGSDML